MVEGIQDGATSNTTVLDKRQEGDPTEDEVTERWRKVRDIEEGRAASKSPHKKFGYFRSISQQAVSADIIQIQLWTRLQ
jgi:hypothetical protein